MKIIKRRSTASETDEQIAFVEWASYNPDLDLLFHTPNGGYRLIQEAVKFKRMGVKSGVPDLFLPEPLGNYHGLWIEMKSSADTAYVTANQRRWLLKLESKGYKAEVCRGCDEAIEVTKEYLKLK